MTAGKKVEKELVELERQYWQAIKDKDVVAAARLTDETCIIAGPQGVSRIDKKELATMMSSSTYTLDDFELKDSDLEVQLLNPDVAIVAYKVHEELTVEGEPVTIDAADSSTWVRRKGRWVCALHTEAIEGDPYGRDRLTAPDSDAI